MKKAQLTAVAVLVVVAIIVASQTFAGWGGGRRAGRGPDFEQGGPVYPERPGPMAQRGPWYGAPGPRWERGAPGPEWEGEGPRWGQRPYAQTPRPRNQAGRAYGICPHCGARTGAGPGTREGFGPWRGQEPRVGAGAGRGQGFQRGQWSPRQRNLGRRDIVARRRLPREDGWEQVPPRPYGGEQGFRRGDAQRPGWNRMENWGPPQRRGMNRRGPEGFRPGRPVDRDQSVTPGSPRGRRGFRPGIAPGNRPEQPPKESPQTEAPAERGGPEVEQ